MTIGIDFPKIGSALIVVGPSRSQSGLTLASEIQSLNLPAESRMAIMCSKHLNIQQCVSNPIRFGFVLGVVVGVGVWARVKGELAAGGRIEPSRIPFAGKTARSRQRNNP